MSAQSDKKQPHEFSKVPIPEPYRDLFAALKKENVAWCSWKSNEHLLDGLEGKTDIDLLFREQDRFRVIDIMRECGFVLFQAPPYRSYPGIIDMISIRPESGKILHAHCHFLLTMGEKYLKNHVLPWNDIALKIITSSALSEDINIISPTIEAVLLIIRKALKLRIRETYGAKANKHIGSAGFRRELDWLRKRTTASELADCATELLDESTSQSICDIFENGATLERLLKLKKLLRKISKKRKWQRLPIPAAMLLAWHHEIIYLFSRVLEKTGQHEKLVRRRILPGEGAVVAILGPDGSGKSTITKTITSQWGGKLDIARVYMGTGEGAQTFLQRLLNISFSIALKLKKQSPEKVKEQTEQTALPNPPWSVLLIAITGVLGKRKQIKRVARLKKRGFLIICDRWPQNQISGMNDGPLLTQCISHPKFLFRTIAKWEKRQFEHICGKMQPDLIIRLIPTLETAVARKAENAEMRGIIEEKIKSLIEIQFPSNITQVDLDADVPLENALSSVRKTIWSTLQKRAVPKPGLYECAGLPGAGKTTLCKEIYKTQDMGKLEDIFISQNPLSTFEKQFLIAKSVISDPLIYLFAIKLMFTLKLWKSATALNYLFRLPVQKLRTCEALRKSQKTPYVLEQLLLQNLWSALISTDLISVEPQSLVPFVARLYQGMNTVILDFDIIPDQASHRVFERQNGTSRFDNLVQPEISKHLNEKSDLMRSVVDAARYAGVPTVKINAALPIEDIARTIVIPLIGAKS